MAIEKLPRPTEGQLWPPVPVFEEPAPKDQLWRYIDFTKFVSMLDRSSLYLANAESFPDKWEGSYPRRDSVLINNPEASKNLEEAERVFNILKERLDLSKKCYINCWHINNHESAAMWDLYAKSGSGVAIQTTYESLRKAIGTTKGYGSDLWFLYPKVNYIDYDTETFAGRVGNTDITPFFHKRKSYQHENEFRIIAHARESRGEGIELSVDLAVLIENLYVSPYSPLWYKQLVASLLNKFGLTSVKVYHSYLERQPIY